MRTTPCILLIRGIFPIIILTITGCCTYTNHLDRYCRAYFDSDFKNAFQLLHPLAVEDDDPTAQLVLGRMYYDGEGVIQDKKRALDLWMRAANNGQPCAATNVGFEYFNGSTLPKNDHAAYAWSMEALHSSNPTPRAFNTLGILYYRGTWVPRNIRRAAFFFSQARDRGDPVGMMNLYELYLKKPSLGVPPEECLKWLHVLKLSEHRWARGRARALLQDAYKLALEKTPYTQRRHAMFEGEMWLKYNPTAIPTSAQMLSKWCLVRV